MAAAAASNNAASKARPALRALMRRAFVRVHPDAVRAALPAAAALNEQNLQVLNAFVDETRTCVSKQRRRGWQPTSSFFQKRQDVLFVVPRRGDSNAVSANDDTKSSPNNRLSGRHARLDIVNDATGNSLSGSDESLPLLGSTEVPVVRARCELPALPEYPPRTPEEARQLVNNAAVALHQLLVQLEVLPRDVVGSASVRGVSEFFGLDDLPDSVQEVDNGETLLRFLDEFAAAAREMCAEQEALARAVDRVRLALFIRFRVRPVFRLFGINGAAPVDAQMSLLLALERVLKGLDRADGAHGDFVATTELQPVIDVYGLGPTTSALAQATIVFAPETCSVDADARIVLDSRNTSTWAAHLSSIAPALVDLRHRVLTVSSRRRHLEQRVAREVGVRSVFAETDVQDEPQYVDTLGRSEFLLPEGALDGLDGGSSEDLKVRVSKKPAAPGSAAQQRNDEAGIVDISFENFANSQDGSRAVRDAVVGQGHRVATAHSRKMDELGRLEDVMNRARRRLRLQRLYYDPGRITVEQAASACARLLEHSPVVRPVTGGLRFVLADEYNLRSDGSLSIPFEFKVGSPPYRRS